MRRATKVFLSVAASMACIVQWATPASAAGSIEGAGASFPQLEFEQWRSDISKAPYDITMNYVSSGSTFGRQQYLDDLVDFGVSDIPFQQDEMDRAARRPYEYVPVSAGGLGFMYNLRDSNGKRVGFAANQGGTSTDLKLTPRTVCRLFTEQGIRWSDPEIAADNPDVALPDQPVKPINRADGAGTTYVFMEYCIRTAPEVWNAFVDYVNKNGTMRGQFLGDPFLDGQPSSRMPSLGPTAFASDGVANTVASDTSGSFSITAVEAGFAEQRGFPNALVRNAAGVFHYPEACNVNVALSFASRNDDGTVTLAYDAQDKGAYFPSTYSYVIAPKEIAADRGNALAQFLQYAVTHGQQRADKLGYAPLSAEIAEIALGNIERLGYGPARPAVVSYRAEGCSSGIIDETPDVLAGAGAEEAIAAGKGSSVGAGGAASGGGGGGTSGGGASTAAGGAIAGDGTASTGVAAGTGTEVAGASVNRQASTGGASLASAATIAERTGDGRPSNRDVVVVLIQGAAVTAAGVLLARRLQRSAAG